MNTKENIEPPNKQSLKKSATIIQTLKKLALRESVVRPSLNVNQPILFKAIADIAIGRSSKMK